MAEKIGSGEIKSLTALRGIAAMAVVMQHFSATAQQYAKSTIPSLVPHGYVAVDFFFVLSGFIMAYTYLGSFQQRGLRAFGPFLAKRVARIVPLNVAVLIIIGIAGMSSARMLGRNIFFSTQRPIFDFLSNGLMLQGIGIGRNLNGPSWSISVEFAAYFLFPIFAFLVFSSRRLAWISTAVAALALIALAWTQPRFGLALEAPPASIVRCFTEFTLGIVSYRLFLFRKIAAFLGRDGVAIAFSVFVLAALAARCDLVAALAFPFIVVAFAENNGIAARFVQIRPFYFLGVISFSLYLLHELFRPIDLEILRHVISHPLSTPAALVFAMIGSCAVIPFAWLAFVAIERPGRTFVRGIFSRRGTSPGQPALAQ